MSYKKLLKLFICLEFILTGLIAQAQNVLLKQTIDKLAAYRNFSYQNIYKQKEAFSDTAVFYKSFLALKTRENQEIGYFFKAEDRYGDMKFPVVEAYDGKSTVSYNPADSTFYLKTSPVLSFSVSLTSQLTWINNFLNDHPDKLIQLGDTVFNTVNSYHLIAITRDTVIGKEHLYTRIHLFIDKVRGLPVGKLVRARTDLFGKEATDYYTEDSYFDYKTDQDNITSDTFSVPAGFHSPKAKAAEQTALLAKGTLAPDWTLYDTDRKKTTLSELKGKIILMDFFFVGCVPCMRTLAPLDRLLQKYKTKDLLILSISDRDSMKLVADFKKSQQIKNQMYPNGGGVAKLYHFSAGPTFYLIDQQGKISAAFMGAPDDFEQKMSALIDDLITTKKIRRLEN